VSAHTEITSHPLALIFLVISGNTLAGIGIELFSPSELTFRSSERISGNAAHTPADHNDVVVLGALILFRIYDNYIAFLFFDKTEHPHFFVN